jgi:hypothetical protein
MGLDNPAVAHAERALAIFFGVIVFIIAGIALRNDWKTPGLENHIFKIMLGLLAVGAVLGILAGAGVLVGKGAVL